jgi:hypothetical protein
MRDGLRLRHVHGVAAFDLDDRRAGAFGHHPLGVPTLESRAEITGLLEAWGQGDKAALDALVPMVHRELRRLAHRYMRRERANAAFETTELINEVYIKLLDCSRVRWQDRRIFSRCRHS